MYKYCEIIDIHGREILDSRGNPTVEAEVSLDNGITGIAAVPSGASTGQFEAVELRDGKKRYGGKGVARAVSNVNMELAESIIHENALNQTYIDNMLIKADNTKNKEMLGANAILGVSMAVTNAAAKAMNIPLFRYIGGISANKMPVPMMNIINGGRHTDTAIDFQEFMIMPVGAESFKDALQMGTEIYHALKSLLNKDGKNTAVGDEGGFAPDLKDAFEVFDYLMKAVNDAGYTPGKDVVFAMDAAASELYQEDAGMYYFPGETRLRNKELELDENGESKINQPDTIKHGVLRNTSEMIDLYDELCKKYPLKSIEDGLAEDDWEGWAELTERIGKKVQLVGDDLFVTNPKRLKKGIENKCANAILVKVNQIGTVSEAMDAIIMAHRAGYNTIISHRSGETEDTFIADLAVAVNAGQIKTGAPCRSERTAKYNELLRIEEILGEESIYECPFCDK